MIECLLEDRPLPVYGDGRQIRDWLHVEDHVASIWLVMQEGIAGETYAVGGENEWENIKLVERLCELVAEKTGKDADAMKESITFVQDRPGHDRRYAIDCTKIKNNLHWRQKVKFDEGLDRTVSWYLENREWVNQVKSGEYRNWIEKNYSERDFSE